MGVIRNTFGICFVHCNHFKILLIISTMLSLLILPPPQVLLNALWSRPTSSSIRKLSIDLTKGKIRSSAFANAGVKNSTECHYFLCAILFIQHSSPALTKDLFSWVHRARLRAVCERRSGNCYSAFN